MLEQRIDEAIEHTDLKHNSILEDLKALSESVSFFKLSDNNFWPSVYYFS